MNTIEIFFLKRQTFSFVKKNIKIITKADLDFCLTDTVIPPQKIFGAHECDDVGYLSNYDVIQRMGVSCWGMAKNLDLEVINMGKLGEQIVIVDGMKALHGVMALFVKSAEHALANNLIDPKSRYEVPSPEKGRFDF